MNRLLPLSLLSTVALGAALTTPPVGAETAPGRSAPATASESTLILWRMNEPRGASVMRDIGGNNIDGLIGDEVVTGESYNGPTGYTCARLKPNTPPAHPEHIVRVPDSNALDPDQDSYVVEIRYRTTNGFGNLIQKGQSKSRVGQFKIQLPGGRVQCHYKGSGGRAGVGYRTPIDDGEWHVLRCERTSELVTLYVDGARQGRNIKPTGDTDNKAPMTIGGKPYCDQIEVTCDYFGGQVDYVRIEKG